MQEIGHVQPAISGARSPGMMAQDELYLRNLIIHGQLPSLPPGSQKQWLEAMAQNGYLPIEFEDPGFISKVVQRGGITPFTPTDINARNMLRPNGGR